MANFQNIKEICTCISQLNAINFAQQSGWEFSAELNFETCPIRGREIEIEQTIKNRGLSAAYGPVRSGAEKNGKWIDFIALNQVLIRDAPNLKSLLNEVSKYFKIELEGKNSLKIIGQYDKDSPDLISSANYFISAEKVYALNLYEQKLMKIVGEQLGGANRAEEGTILELNAEKTLDLSVVIHELIHLKWPEDIQQLETTVNEVQKKVYNELANVGFRKVLDDSEIQNERAEALKAFELLDGDLEKFFTN